MDVQEKKRSFSDAEGEESDLYEKMEAYSEVYDEYKPRAIQEMRKILESCKALSQLNEAMHAQAKERLGDTVEEGIFLRFDLRDSWEMDKEANVQELKIDYVAKLAEKFLQAHEGEPCFSPEVSSSPVNFKRQCLENEDLLLDVHPKAKLTGAKTEEDYAPSSPSYCPCSPSYNPTSPSYSPSH